MLFNSYIFIFLFLPLCLVGYYILQKNHATLAKVWLTCFSLWFYGYFNQYYLLIMVCSIIGNYFIHRKIMAGRENLAEEGRKKLKVLLITGVTINLLVLFYFKYFDFFLENLNVIFHSNIPLKNILLPLGISFFTFQQISFLADSYWGEMDQYAANRKESKGKGISFVDYALFVSFFPQLIAGPIVVHEEMLPQFARIGKEHRNKEEKMEIFTKGIYVFVLGLAKKVLIADTFGIAVDLAYSDVTAINGLESFLTILFYSLQLYFDFSGYCDMAKGIAGMFGMQIANNFDSPYKAINIVEFWKRWHITLSRFFTKNIYIPLGGNRKGEVRMYVNYFIVFFLSGLWHGAGWNFIIWGIMHGILYIVTKKYLNRKQKTSAIKKEENVEIYKKIAKITGDTHKKTLNVQHLLGGIFNFTFVSIAWVYFRASSVQQANLLLRNVFTKAWSLPGTVFFDAFNLGEFWYVLKILKVADWPYSESYLMIGFTVVALAITFLGKNIDELAEKFKPSVLNAVLTAVLLIWCVVSLSGVSTFLYFNF